MSYLDDFKQVYEKQYIAESHDVYLYFSNTHLQGFAPRGSTIYDGLHGPLEAVKFIDDDDPLEDLGGEIHFPWCDSFTPIIKHLLQACNKDGPANKCWEKHFSYHILWQLGVKICWFHLRDHCPSPLLHMAASMTLIMIPYAEIFLIFVWNMDGGKTHWLDVSLGKGISQTFCTTCFKGGMGCYMATMVDHLFLCEVSHMIVWDIPLISIWQEFFYEFPSWEVIHFIWMIAWIWESFIDDEIPHDYHHFYLEEAMDCLLYTSPSPRDS